MKIIPLTLGTNVLTKNYKRNVFKFIFLSLFFFNFAFPCYLFLSKCKKCISYKILKFEVQKFKKT